MSANGAKKAPEAVVIAAAAAVQQQPSPSTQQRSAWLPTLSTHSPFSKPKDQGKMSERIDEHQPSAFRPIRDALLPSSPTNQRKTLESITAQSVRRQSAQTATEPESKPNTETKNKPAKNKRMTLKQLQQPPSRLLDTRGTRSPMIGVPSQSLGARDF